MAIGKEEMARVIEESTRLLEVKDIIKDFPGVRALKKLSFDLPSQFR